MAHGDGRDRPDLVDELAPALERLGAAGLPIVITVEDLHLADASLVELLARLLAAQGAPVLVISTAWRGLLDDDSLPAHQLIERVHPDRVCRVLTDEALPDLALGEREVIVRAILPEVSAWNANLVASSFTHPLALQLACHVGLLSNADRNLGAPEVAGLPRDVEGLFGQLWSELTQTTREVLMVAALSTPAGVSDSMGLADFRWDSSLLTAVSNTEAWPGVSAPDLSAVLAQIAMLAQTSEASAWVRADDATLRLFPDPAQYDVALSQAKVAYDDAQRRSVYEAMARAMSAGVVESPAQEEHRARLLVALAYEGFVAWDESAVAGAVDLCSSLLGGSDLSGSLLADPDVNSCRYVIRLVESALHSASTQSATGGQWLTLREAYARSLGGSGRVAEAITALEQLLADQVRVLDPDAPQTLATRHHVAGWLGRSGRVAEAITAFEQLLADRTRLLGSDHPDTLTTRNNLAWLLGRSGRVAEAITAYERLLADRTRVLGPEAPQTVTTRSNLDWLEQRRSDREES